MSVENIAKYLVGSVQPVAASKDKAKAVPITHIMSRETTFAKYYDKEIVSECDIIQEAVLI